MYCFLRDLQGISGFECCIGLLEQYRRIWNLQSLDVIQSFPRLEDSATGNIIRAYQRSKYFNAPLQDEIDIALRQIPALDFEKVPTGMGLFSGYAGEGMLRLTAINQTNISWMSLL